jgi:pimeloyl-ACP methyl ester carboxylesterase
MLAAALSVLTLVSGVPSTAADPVDAAFTANGPYATTTGVVTIGGHATYDLFTPSNYRALPFASPIITWGNGTGASPGMYSTLLNHFSSYGFTVIASTLPNTGSGREIDAAAHYLVAQDGQKDSPFFHHLNVREVAAVGHSQGATGVVRAAVADPALITTVITFSLPAEIYSLPNPDCATSADCTPKPWLLTQPIFFISTLGPEDAFIANPAVEHLDFDDVPRHAAMGVIFQSGSKDADHSSIQNTAAGGDPQGELGYPTAWLEYQLLGNAKAAKAFTGANPELEHNSDWFFTAIK